MISWHLRYTVVLKTGLTQSWSTKELADFVMTCRLEITVMIKTNVHECLHFDLKCVHILTNVVPSESIPLLHVKFANLVAVRS